MSRALATIALLILSNTFMTLAWYGHIRFQIQIKALPDAVHHPAQLGDRPCRNLFPSHGQPVWQLQIGRPLLDLGPQMIPEFISLRVFRALPSSLLNRNLAGEPLGGFVRLIRAPISFPQKSFKKTSFS